MHNTFAQHELKMATMTPLAPQWPDMSAEHPLELRPLELRPLELIPRQLDAVDILNDQADAYEQQGDYAQAIQLYQQALAIREQATEADPQLIAASLTNLANLYQKHADYAQAKPLHKRALAMRQQALEPQHPDIASSLYNLASLYKSQQEYATAEQLYSDAQAIYQALSHKQRLPASITPAHYWAERAAILERKEAELDAEEKRAARNQELEAANNQLMASNDSLQQEQQQNERLLQRYTHTLANTLFPKILYDLATHLNNDATRKKEALILQQAYQAETAIILENELLLIRYSSTNAEQFRQKVRENRSTATDPQAYGIVDILNYALSQVIARILNQNYAKMATVRAAILTRHGPTLATLQQDFETTILPHDPPQQAWQWCHNNLIN